MADLTLKDKLELNAKDRAHGLPSLWEGAEEGEGMSPRTDWAMLEMRWQAERMLEKMGLHKDPITGRMMTTEEMIESVAGHFGLDRDRRTGDLVTPRELVRRLDKRLRAREEEMHWEAVFSRKQKKRRTLPWWRRLWDQITK